MESFELIEHPETIRLLDYPELIKPNVKIDDIRKVIKDKIGIKEENQRFELVGIDRYHFEFRGDYNFWENFELKVYDKTRYYTGLGRSFYQTEIILDLKRKLKI